MGVSWRRSGAVGPVDPHPALTAQNTPRWEIAATSLVVSVLGTRRRFKQAMEARYSRERRLGEKEAGQRRKGQRRSARPAAPYEVAQARDQHLLATAVAWVAKSRAELQTIQSWCSSRSRDARGAGGTRALRAEEREDANTAIGWPSRWTRSTPFRGSIDRQFQSRDSTKTIQESRVLRGTLIIHADSAMNDGDAFLVEISVERTPNPLNSRLLFVAAETNSF